MPNVIHIIACKMFEPELNAVLEHLKKDKIFDMDIHVTYLHAGLHNDLNKLANTVFGALDANKDDKIILLYGSKCHPCFNEILEGRGIYPFPEDNCVKLIKPDAPSYEKGVMHLSTGWIKHWRELGEDPFGNYDEIGARLAFGGYDKMIVYDTGASEITDEEIMDIFETIGVPIETEQIPLNHFKNRIIDAIKHNATG